MFNNIDKDPGLSIIIVGCGKVGSTLVEQLSKEGQILATCKHIR